MTQGTILLFEENAKALGDGEIDLSGATIKFGIVDDTITPTAPDATPTWSDYSANEVSTAGGYPADGVQMTNVAFLEVDGIATLQMDSFQLPKNAAGFTDAYWGIIYITGTDLALGFMDLGGPIQEDAATIKIRFNAAAVGALGDVLTITVNP